MKVHEDIIPFGASSKYNLHDGVTICFFKNLSDVDCFSSEQNKDVSIPILSISPAKAKSLIETLNSNYGPFKHLMLIKSSLIDNPKKIGFGVAGWKWED